MHRSTRVWFLMWCHNFMMVVKKSFHAEKWQLASTICSTFILVMQKVHVCYLIVYIFDLLVLLNIEALCERSWGFITNISIQKWLIIDRIWFWWEKLTNVGHILFSQLVFRHNLTITRVASMIVTLLVMIVLWKVTDIITLHPDCFSFIYLDSLLWYS